MTPFLFTNPFPSGQSHNDTCNISTWLLFLYNLKFRAMKTEPPSSLENLCSRPLNFHYSTSNCHIPLLSPPLSPNPVITSTSPKIQLFQRRHLTPSQQPLPMPCSPHNLTSANASCMHFIPHSHQVQVSSPYFQGLVQLICLPLYSCLHILPLTALSYSWDTLLHNPSISSSHTMPHAWTTFLFNQTH